MPESAQNPIEKYQFIHHFVPHPHHRTRAKLLSQNALFGYLFAILSLFLFLNFFPKYYPGVLGYASDISIGDLLTETNEMRAKNGEAPLTLNDSLSRAAQRKADDMFRDDYWAHIAPDGVEPWDFILAENYDYVYAGENLAKNFNTSEDVVEAWFNSPSHKENLLSSNYNEIGFAVVNGTLDGYETTLVVQMFGKARSAPAATTQVAVATEVEQIAEQDTQESEEVAEQPVSEQQAVQVPPPESQEFNSTNVLSEEFAPAGVLPAVDVGIAYRAITTVFVLFLGILLVLDMWYSKKKGIPKFTGHTIVHLTFLIITMVGMLLALAPGQIL